MSEYQETLEKRVIELEEIISNQATTINRLLATLNFIVKINKSSVSMSYDKGMRYIFAAAEINPALNIIEGQYYDPFEKNQPITKDYKKFTIKIIDLYAQNPEMKDWREEVVKFLINLLDLHHISFTISIDE